MTSKIKTFSLLMAGTFLSTNTIAAEVPQALTIDRLAAETAAFLENSGNISVHELNTTSAGETDVVVRIDGKTYYFTPADAEQGAALQTLDDIGSAALKELPDSNGAIYNLNGKYYGYDAQKLPTSGYSLSKISKEEAENASYPVVKKYTENSDNTLTETYYKVNIPEIGSGNQAKYFKWKKDSEGRLTLVAATNAGEADITVKYREDGEDGRTVYTTRQTSFTGGQNIDADFIGSSYTSSSAYGGAISNSSNSTIGNITGDFITILTENPRFIGG